MAYDEKKRKEARDRRWRRLEYRMAGRTHAMLDILIKSIEDFGLVPLMPAYVLTQAKRISRLNSKMRKVASPRIFRKGY